MNQLRAFFAGRFDTSTYLGLHLTLSLGVAAAGVWLFSSLLDAVLDRAMLVRFDQSAARIIHVQTTPAGLAFFNVVSWVGDPFTMLVGAVIGAIVLLRRGWTIRLVMWVAAFAGGEALEHVLKAVVHRSRPPYGTAYLTDASFSFPSGHAMMSFIGCGIALYVVFVAVRPPVATRIALAAATTILVVLVGMSRVYLGVHFPSDVLGGWAAGAAWLAVCTGVAGIVLHRRGLTLS